MPMKKLSALLGGVLFLIAGAWFAEEPRPDSYSAGLDSDAEKKFAALLENGRAAYKRALIACSLYADDYADANYENECKTAYQSFEVEFVGKFIRLIFKSAPALC
jgi:hypothetical protein